MDKWKDKVRLDKAMSCLVYGRTMDGGKRCLRHLRKHPPKDRGVMLGLMQNFMARVALTEKPQPQNVEKISEDDLCAGLAVMREGWAVAAADCASCFGFEEDREGHLLRSMHKC